MRERIKEYKNELQEYANSYGQHHGMAYFVAIGLVLIAEIGRLEKELEREKENHQLDINDFVRQDLHLRTGYESEMNVLRKENERYKASGEGGEMIPVETFTEVIPDGLLCKCPYCGRRPEIDYIIDDEIWQQLVPREYRIGVVCLECFAKLARKHGIAWIKHLRIMYWGSPQITLKLKIEKIYLPKTDIFDCERLR